MCPGFYSRGSLYSGAGQSVSNPKPDNGEIKPNFYGRRSGRALRDVQREHLKNDLAGLTPGLVSREDNPNRTLLDLNVRFGSRSVWLEIGFGSGEHLVHQATANPDVAIIGCEPFINGVASLLGKIQDADIGNVAIYPDDGRDLFEVLPKQSVDRAFLLYPDPWPKTRHHRRRFVTSGYLTSLARVMKTGAVFRLATDIPDYVRQAKAEIPKCGFHLCNEGVGEGSGWADWVTTRYERKALREGRVPHYLTYERG